MLKQLFLNLSIPGWIFFILFWVLLGVAIWYYRKTLPPLSPYRRFLLTTLRSLSLILFFFILFKPVLQLFLEKREKPTVAILYDNSSSMKIKDTFGVRGDSLTFLRKNLRNNWSSDSLVLRQYQFNGRLSVLSKDSLSFDGSQTNLSSALENIQDSLRAYNIQAIVLLSDGQFNAGANPIIQAKKSAVPIYSICLGDSLPKKDVRITNLRFPAVAYAGDSVLIKVGVSQSGFSSENRLVKLIKNQRLLSSKNIQLPPGGFEKEIEFTVKTEEPGEVRFLVDIESSSDEVTAQNNRRQFLLNILKSKLKVLLISGEPLFDQRLLIQVLKQLPDIELQVLSENNLGNFYEKYSQPVIPDSMDALIMLGYPTRNSQTDFLNRCLLSIQNRKIPVFFILNRSIYLPSLHPLFEFLALQKDSRLIETAEVIPELTTAGALHPVTRLGDDWQVLQELWKNLPPITSYGRGLKFSKPVIKLLNETSSAESAPPSILYASSYAENKALVLAAANFGSWHFQLQDDPQRENLFKQFIDQSIRWLVNREDIQRINIYPNQKVVKRGDVIEFSGQVFDEFYRPLPDAQVEIKIEGKNFQLLDMINPQGDEYRYHTSGLPSGTFTYQIKVKRGDQPVGQVNGQIVVEELELELQETRANPVLMREIALISGGKFWSIQQLLKEIDQFQFTEKTQLLSIEYVLWNQWYWLVILLLCLSSEWFFRKRWGLL